MGKREIDFEIQEMSFKKVLVAVDEDDSSSSQKAFNYAVTFARNARLPLGIVTIMETKDLSIYESMQPEVLDEHRQAMQNSVDIYVKKAKDFGIKDVQGFIGEGKPAKVIVQEIVPEFKPDLLVCGSETKEKSSIFIGTQASYMSQNAPCSVIVVR